MWVSLIISLLLWPSHHHDVGPLFRLPGFALCTTHTCIIRTPEALPRDGGDIIPNTNASTRLYYVRGWWVRLLYPYPLPLWALILGSAAKLGHIKAYMKPCNSTLNLPDLADTNLRSQHRPREGRAYPVIVSASVSSGGG